MYSVINKLSKYQPSMKFMHIYWSFNGSLRERQRETERHRERQRETERDREELDYRQNVGKHLT